MKLCKNCGLPKVDPEDMPRYDVHHPGFLPGQDMSIVGPYCADCFMFTTTGRSLM